MSTGIYKSLAPQNIKLKTGDEEHPVVEVGRGQLPRAVSLRCFDFMLGVGESVGGLKEE